MITQERLQEVLSYNAETGIFNNIKNRSNAKAGDVAGYKRTDGFIIIRIDGIKYSAHRLAWLYVYGEFPENFLNHVNKIKDDNRFCNIKLTTNQENQHSLIDPQKNNTSGYRGVSWIKASKTWVSIIKVNGKKKYLGAFLTAELAHEAYLKAKKELHKIML